LARPFWYLDPLDGPPVCAMQKSVVAEGAVLRARIRASRTV
jgi:hypothetical protein